VQRERLSCLLQSTARYEVELMCDLSVHTEVSPDSVYGSVSVYRTYGAIVATSSIDLTTFEACVLLVVVMLLMLRNTSDGFSIVSMRAYYSMTINSFTTCRTR
jgi:hypothetical protein